MTGLLDQVDALWLAWSQADEGRNTEAVLNAFSAVIDLLEDDRVWWVDCLEATAADASWLERIGARAGCEDFLLALAEAFSTLATELASDNQSALAEVAASMLDQAETMEEQTEEIVDPFLDLGEWQVPGWMKAVAAVAVFSLVYRG